MIDASHELLLLHVDGNYLEFVKRNVGRICLEKNTTDVHEQSRAGGDGFYCLKRPELARTLLGEPYWLTIQRAIVHFVSI